MVRVQVEMEKAASDRGLWFVRVTSNYERPCQSAFVRSRMAMKLGTKMVEAEASATSARYIVFLLWRARPVMPGLRRSNKAFGINDVWSVPPVMRS